MHRTKANSDSAAACTKRQEVINNVALSPRLLFFLSFFEGGSRSNSTARYPLCFCTSLSLNQHTVMTVTHRQVALLQRWRPRRAISKPLTAPVPRRTACRLYTSQSGPCTPAPCILGSPPRPALESEREGGGRGEGGEGSVVW